MILLPLFRPYYTNSGTNLNFSIINQAFICCSRKECKTLVKNIRLSSAGRYERKNPLSLSSVKLQQYYCPAPNNKKEQGEYKIFL